MLEPEATKACFKCGELKTLSMFYRDTTMTSGYRNKCKACNSVEASSKKDTTSIYKKRWLKANTNKREAHVAVESALKYGKLVKPNSCVKCGKTGCTIYGHHWSYLPEHQLDVLWVCSSCHGKEHRKS